MLIDEDQSGFMRGRSISENFVYATEFVQCCHKRAAPTVVLKLDFSKAFDSINWESLRAVMEVRGFPVVWCDWIDAILRSSHSAVLLNGVPGKWLKLKCGLRQGDPISPYLFLIVADVLQRLIRQDGVMRHPLVPHAPAVVLQYADDTLIVMRACEAGAARLRQILDMFAEATGLRINFSKSMLVPVHVEQATQELVVRALGCAVGSFTQIYLGLPLSWEKLKFSGFPPMLAKVDKYLAGWAARLLSPAARLVLINAVLDALPTYAMAALILPLALIRELDALRRAFLWNVAEHASGAQCLVAREHVCRAKSEGGLGVRNLATQNECLLMKMIHHLHTTPRSRWAEWV